MTMTASSRAWIVALALLAPTTAFADPPSSPPSEAQVEAARSLYHEARELRRAGKLTEALEKALAAYRIAATPVTAVEVGGLLVEVGRLVEARDLVRGVTSLPVSPRESDKGKDARQQAAALGASLDARIPKIALASRPAGTTLSLDGKPMPNVDPSAWQGVDPGAHALVVMVEGKACTTINVTLAEGEERTIDLHDAAIACRKEPAPVPTPLASAALPDPTPQPPPPAPEPTHPPPDTSTTRWIGLAIAGAGAVAIGVGGGLALGAKSQYDSVASECPSQGCTQAGFDTRSSARSRADVASVIMGLGGAAVAGGVLLWVFAPSSVANVGVSAGGVTVHARW